jgi:hypothetical protein
MIVRDNSQNLFTLFNLETGLTVQKPKDFLTRIECIDSTRYGSGVSQPSAVACSYCIKELFRTWGAGVNPLAAGHSDRTKNSQPLPRISG